MNGLADNRHDYLDPFGIFPIVPGRWRVIRPIPLCSRKIAHQSKLIALSANNKYGRREERGAINRPVVRTPFCIHAGIVP
jgi:hypothetical protein